MFHFKKEEKLYSIAVIFWITLLFATHIIWTSLNKSSFSWDQSIHASHTLEAKKNVYNLFNLEKTEAISSYYPPGFYYMSAFLLIFLDTTEFNLRMVSFFFYLANIVTFLVIIKQKKYEGNIFTVIALFCIYSLLPGNILFSRDYLLDLPQTTILSLGYLFLILYIKNKRIKFYIFMLLFFLFSLLVKWTSIVFIVIPFFILARSAFQNSKNNLERIKIILISVFLSGVVLTPWYSRNFLTLFSLAKNFSRAEITDPQSIFSLENIFYYPVHFTNEILGLPLSIFFAASFIYSLYYKVKPFFLLHFFLTYFVFTFLISNKDSRYLLPILPVVVLFVAMTALKLNKNLQKLLFILTFIYYLILNLVIFDKNEIVKINLNIPILDNKSIEIFSTNLISQWKPNENKSTFYYVNNLFINQCKNSCYVLLAADLAEVNIFSFDYLNSISDSHITYSDYAFFKNTTEKKWHSYLNLFKYVIIPSKLVATEESQDLKLLLEIKNRITTNNCFEKIGQAKVNNNNELLLYKKNYILCAKIE